MPQFEVEPRERPAAFVRAKSDLDAVARQVGAPAEIALDDAEPGTGWRAVAVDGEPWGRVRPRDRMRFRRD